MRFVRARAAWLAGVTLVLQVTVIASASAALCCGPGHPSGMDEMACCKAAGGAPHVCPLKKSPKPGVPTMEGCCTPDQQAFAALFALSGPPEAPHTLSPIQENVTPRMRVIEQALALAAPPDAPPPRA